MATRFFPKPLNRFTSRKGSRGSPSSRALPDQFERETERAQSHLGTYDNGIDKTMVGHGAHDPVIACPWRIDTVGKFSTNVTLLHSVRLTG
jgi:hypothetical protein